MLQGNTHAKGVWQARARTLGGVCTALQMAQALPAPLPMEDGGEEAQHPLLTHRTGCQDEGKTPLA